MRIRLHHTRLQQLLAQSAISQNNWAMRLGLSKGHLSNLLAGKHLYPSARTRERMLEVLAVPFEALFEVEPGHELPEHGIQGALRDQYLIDIEIGQGGMGIVYLARDTRLGRPVAIKIVNSEVVSGVGSKALLKEIINTNRLQHPNILPIFDAGEAESSPYYVMPYVRGGSLRDLLKREGRLPIDRVLRLLAGVAAALDHAHALGVLHCDVKPDNVLLSEEHAWLIDFGVARVIQAEVWAEGWHSEFDSGAGTPAYVSPEQASGDPNLDRRSDVYSLACMTYEMLAGQTPFAGTTTLATVAKRFTGPPPVLTQQVPSIPIELSEALSRAMSVDRERRTATAGEFVADCARAVVVAATNVGAPARTPRVDSTSTVTERIGMLSRNLRHTLRGIARAPGVAVAVALTLGLGIGVNAAMFGMIDRLFFRAPAGVRAPHELRRMYVRRNFLGREVTNSSLAFPTVDDLRSVPATKATAAFFSTSLSLDRGREATTAATLMATHDFFSLLGVQPLLGRFYSAEEDAQGAAGTAVLTYDFWQRRFQGDRNVLGRTLRLGGGSYIVIGVTPRGFNGIDLERVDLFLPLKTAAHENIGGDWEHSRGIQWVRALTRLAPGTSELAATAAATTQLRMAQAGVRRADPKAAVVAGPLLVAMGPEASREHKVSLWLGGVSLILLIIACANVMNLLLTRLTHRDAELAIRAALGASRGRLVGQIVVETLVLSLAAALVGLFLAQWGGIALARTLLPDVALASPLTDVRVIGFTLVTAFVAGLLAGVVPAWRGSKPDLITALKVGRGGARSGRSVLQSGLLIFQASLSVVLLVGAGLFVRSMRQIRGLDAGLDLNHLMMASADLRGTGLTPIQQRNAQLRVMEKLRQLPGVTAVTASNSIPFNTSWAEDLSIPGVDSIPSVRSGGPYINMVGQDYFRTVGTGLRDGRAFDGTDREGSARVAIVGETMAELIWPKQSPLGKCLKIGGDTMPCTTIVGVAKDAPRSSLLDRANAQYYVPAEQYQPDVPYAAFFIRTAGNPALLTTPVRRTLQEMAPDLPVVDVQPLWELAAPETRSWQLGATLFTLFGVLAIVVAAIGLYSVLSFAVARRRREFGIRTALGASVPNVIALVLSSGMRLVVVGLVVGLLIALAAGRAIAPLLFDTNPLDPVVYGVVAGVLLVTAVFACLMPAWRAARVAPMEALRSE
ncbi:MAG: ADOP family duplicated permease [Gemmatimonadota bacterium]